MAEKKKIAKAAKGIPKSGLRKVFKRAVERRKEAVAGGGGMHQMGPARKTKRKLNAKERALMALRKKKGKII